MGARKGCKARRLEALGLRLGPVDLDAVNVSELREASFLPVVNQIRGLYQKLNEDKYILKIQKRKDWSTVKFERRGRAEGRGSGGGGALMSRALCCPATSCSR